MSRVLGELRVPGCGSGLVPGRFWGGGEWSPSHSTCWNVAPWVGAVGFEPLPSLVPAGGPGPGAAEGME